MKTGNSAFSMVLLTAFASSAFADLYHVSLDVSGLGGGGLQVQAALYDNSGIIGDSWVRLDNVRLGPAVDNFESGTLGAFDASLNPSSVNAVSGSLNGGGSFLLQMDEDPGVTPTIVFRDYLSPSGNTLTLDLEMTASTTAGPWGLFDEFVISLLDPATLAPLAPGLTGWGDAVVVNAEGIAIVPAPAALLLGLLGLGAGGLGLQRGRLRSA